MYVRKIAVALFLLSMATGQASSKEDRLQASLRQLDPATRLEQICGIEAMKRIRREAKQFKPERAVLAAASKPTDHGTKLEGTGAAFRSSGTWYQFSFTCDSSEDRMKVLSFSYQVGSEIPQDKWATYGLWE